MNYVRIERGYHWTPEEDVRLREAFAAGITSSALAVELARTPEAIRKRAERIGVRSNYIASVTKDHGPGAYRRGCRCEVCRAAAAKYQRASYVRLRGTKPPVHGTNTGYQLYGCKCWACKEAGAEANRKAYLNRKERVRDGR